MIESVRWRLGSLRVLDQSRLPGSEKYLELTDFSQVLDCIRSLKVRGAPALGIMGAYGLCLGMLPHKSLSIDKFRSKGEELAKLLISARPTAVNLRVGVEHVLGRLRVPEVTTSPELFEQILDIADQFLADDISRCSRMTNYGVDLVPQTCNILTHCNTGGLATGGVGTALGIVIESARRGSNVHVYVDETRPLFQGARLTAWELKKSGIRHTVICDNAAGYLMASGKVDCVIVGADRIAVNGDTANKIGTYSLAVLSEKHHIPFYVAAPFTSVDKNMSSGNEIMIEHRSGSELTSGYGSRLLPEDTQVFNPAFDITPGSMISAIVTEFGIARGPTYDLSKFN